MPAPGPLVLPTSALQGLPLAAATRALLRLRPDALQLCPGNLPSPGLESLLRGAGALVHHGFSWTARSTPVWDEAGEPLVPLPGRTVHPPDAAGPVEEWLDRHPDAALELMPPGRWMGDERSLNAAMSRGMALAVDTSHLHMLDTAGALGAATRSRLLDYERVVEVHLSDNDGQRDLHRPPHAGTPGAAWARARKAAGTPLVLEARLHRLAPEDRVRLVEAWR